MSKGRAPSQENLEAFDKINRLMRYNRNYSWEEFTTKFLNVEKYQTISKNEMDIENSRVKIVAYRSIIKTAMNNMAKTQGKPWRLYVTTKGETIYKANVETMVLKELVKRLISVSGSIKLIPNKMKPMLNYTGISKDDQAILNFMINQSEGVRLSWQGGINNLKCLPKDIKEDMVNNRFS